MLVHVQMALRCVSKRSERVVESADLGRLKVVIDVGLDGLQKGGSHRRCLPPPLGCESDIEASPVGGLGKSLDKAGTLGPIDEDRGVRPSGGKSHSNR